MSAPASICRPNILRYAHRLVPNRTKPMPQFLNSRRYQSTRTRPSFTYHIAAASAGKRTPPRLPQPGTDYWLYASTHENPYPPYLRSTKADSGEDAFFATTIGSSPHHVAFGIADGVGGWQDQGIDPSEFSHGLCGLMAGTAHLYEMSEKGLLRAQLLLQTAYDAVMANPRILAGGSTASLAVADGDGNVEAANLGDSAFLIFGPGKVAFRSQIQQHAFNTPYQMSKVPAKMKAQYQIFGGGAQHFSETPKQADVTRHVVRHGDVVVFATDGVWDNLSAQDTLGIVTRVMEEGGYWSTQAQEAGAETMLDSALISRLPQRIEEKDQDSYLPGLLATAIMREAKVAGLDRRRDGPFAKEVNMRFPNEGWSGGKPDDIAVVVCVAVDGAVEGKKEEERPIKAKL